MWAEILGLDPAQWLMAMQVLAAVGWMCVISMLRANYKLTAANKDLEVHMTFEEAKELLASMERVEHLGPVPCTNKDRYVKWVDDDGLWAHGYFSQSGDVANIWFEYDYSKFHGPEAVELSKVETKAERDWCQDCAEQWANTKWNYGGTCELYEDDDIEWDDDRYLGPHRPPQL